MGITDLLLNYQRQLLSSRSISSLPRLCNAGPQPWALCGEFFLSWLVLGIFTDKWQALQAAAAAGMALLLLAGVTLICSDTSPLPASLGQANTVHRSAIQHLAAKFNLARQKAQSRAKDLAAEIKARASVGHKSPPSLLPRISGLADAGNGTSASDDDDESDSACPSPSLADTVTLKARTWGLHFTADVINHLPGKKLEQVGFVRASIGDWNQLMTFYDDSGGVAGEFDPGDKIVAKAWKPIFSWGVDSTHVEDCAGKPIVTFNMNQGLNDANSVARYEIDDDDDNELVRTLDMFIHTMTAILMSVIDIVWW